VRVVVIGAGVVGLACAYELRRQGAEVLVLDRAQVGEGASRGNTGWVCPSFTYPLPGPGIVRDGLRSMVRGGGPLSIAPTPDPTFIRWLLGFRKSATRERWERGTRAFVALNRRTLELFDAYAADGVEFEMHRSGLLLVATTSTGLAPYQELFRSLRTLGFEGATTELRPDAAVDMEPALSRDRIVGAVHAEIDRYVRPESLTGGVAAWLRAHDVEVREGVEVEDISQNGRVQVQTARGREEADRVIVAAGAGSPPMLQKLGVRMPLVGARGYSLTTADSSTRPRHALYLAEAKVGISSYVDSVRVAGVFELGRRRDELDRKRFDAMLASCEPYFEAWRPAGERPLLEWAGLRPMTADGLPLVGRSPAMDRVFLATGHGMLGVTLAPATAAALAPLVLEGREAPELAPFRPDRRP
jgi:D-amino-acid dehydrogenase